MAPTLRNSRDFGTSKYQLEEEITPFRTIAEDRNAIRTAAPSLVGEMGYRKRLPRKWPESALGVRRVKTQRRANCVEKYPIGSALWEREQHTELRRRGIGEAGSLPFARFHVFTQAGSQAPPSEIDGCASTSAIRR
jgi:hypothetical protein